MPPPPQPGVVEDVSARDARLKELIASDVQQLVQDLERVVSERDAAYRKVESEIKALMLKKHFAEALRALDSDPDYVRYRDHPRFRALRDDVARQRDESAKP